MSNGGDCDDLAVAYDYVDECNMSLDRSQPGRALGPWVFTSLGTLTTSDAFTINTDTDTLELTGGPSAPACLIRSRV